MRKEKYKIVTPNQFITLKGTLVEANRFESDCGESVYVLMYGIDIEKFRELIPVRMYVLIIGRTIKNWVFIDD